IDEVGVFDLRIHLPDLWPQPRLVEEASGDVPKRIAADHGVGGWRVLTYRDPSRLLSRLHYLRTTEGKAGQQQGAAQWTQLPCHGPNLTHCHGQPLMSQGRTANP